MLTKTSSGVFMAVNMAWPRGEVYDPSGHHWYLQYLGLLFLAAVVLVGLLCRKVARGEAGGAG